MIASFCLTSDLMRVRVLQFELLHHTVIMLGRDERMNRHQAIHTAYKLVRSGSRITEGSDQLFHLQLTIKRSRSP